MSNESRLDILTQESLTYSRSGAGRSMPSSLSALQSFKLENDDSYWSWNYLKVEINNRELQGLFEKYRFRIKQSVFTVGLLILIVYSLIRIPSLICFTKVGDPMLTVVFYGALIFLCIILLLVLCIVKDEPSCKITWYIICIVMIVFIELTDYVFIFYNWTLSGSPRLSPTFIYLLIIYNFLPFSHPYVTVAADLLVTVIDLFFSGFVFYEQLAQHFGKGYRVELLAADVVFLVACNVLGIYKLYLDEVNQRRSFLDHCHCIESDLECNAEKLQEEKLMLSILPPHIVSRVLSDLKSHLENRGTSEESKCERLFSNSYIEKHENVSILFSDMVNSVKLTSTLTAKQLVIVLNELFGCFDEIANKNDCERLRILGDCYIAVCGLPNFNKDHAKNCVLMGLQMIDVIRTFREEQGIGIDMRIGVHSGNVMSGILGISRLQFDIWSSDVDLAHLLEQTGRPGRVHVSDNTKELLGDIFCYEENPSFLTNELAIKRGIKSYFISQKEETNEQDKGYYSDEHDGVKCIINQNRRRYESLHSFKHFSWIRGRRFSAMTLSSELSEPGAQVASFQTQRGDREGVKAQVKNQMNTAINEMRLSKREQWLNYTNIHPFLIRFSDNRVEEKFVTENDPLYKYYLIAVLFIFITLFTINSLSSLSGSIFSYLPYVVLVMPLVFLAYSAWHDYIMNVNKHHDRPSLPQNPRGLINSTLTAWSRDGFTKRIRVTIFILTSILLTGVVLFNLSMCTIWDDEECKSYDYAIFNNATKIGIVHPRFYTYSITLVLTSVAAFLRIHYALKLFMYLVIVIAFHLILIFLSDDIIYESFIPSNFITNSFPVDQSVFVIIVALCHHMMDRQIEYLSRLDYLWKCHLKQKKEESSTTHMVNTILFRNIVPLHVAEFFLNGSNENKFYNEDYSHVAVMFANIPNFSDFYDELKENEGGLKCLIILDKIIQDLDKVILKTPEFNRVEKIKVIGSTYMAAAGLKPNRRNSIGEENDEELEPFPAETNVITLVNLAFQMMTKLEDINKSTIQEFRFRIGIDFGPLSAGVVGAQRPFYDIWGDPVNVASRMESTGEMGKIQVTEKTAEVLIGAGYTCECRGEVFIKGKGNLKTYFVTDLPQGFQLDPYEETTKF